MSRKRQNTASTEKWSSKGMELNPMYRDVKPEEVCVGSIVWLRQRRPNEEEITCVRQGHCSDDFKLLDNGYRHPVVVLKIWQRRGSTEPGDLMLGVSDVSCYQTHPYSQVQSAFLCIDDHHTFRLGLDWTSVLTSFRWNSVISETKQRKS
jgi:hypothetical protein